jgi:NAD(P)-dependent dehydrogenase (short-subunit alcohol dehydrogenase family)
MHPKGHAALVTGGGSGLGRATAAKLASAGAKVAILDINIDAAREAAAKIGAIAIACDVADADQTAAAVAQARDMQGPARILINCAGIGPAKRVVGRDGPQPLDDFIRVINVNLVGTFNAMRLAAHAMSTLEPLEDGERGVIISTASVAAYEGQIGQAAYSASKGGVVGMTLPMARELARFGIRVVTIAPGIFWTPMVDSMPPQVQESLSASIPFPSRLGQPNEYASTVAFILGNRYINGETIRLDGAVRLQPK